MTKFTPVLDFGFEKYLQKFPNTFVRFEGDYYLKVKKSGHLVRNDVKVVVVNNNTADTSVKGYTRTAAIKNKLDGYAIRLALGRSF